MNNRIVLIVKNSWNVAMHVENNVLGLSTLADKAPGMDIQKIDLCRK